LNPEEQEQRKRLRELARGLIASEYWELIRVVVVGGLEAAKAELESFSTSKERLRACQGMASAYRSLNNFLLELGKTEEENG
jgi:hypothetical protein